jgi:hypothetical protein
MLTLRLSPCCLPLLPRQHCAIFSESELVTSSSYCCYRHCRSPPPLFATSPNPSGKDAVTRTQEDSIPPTIAIPRHRCPRRTSRWASSTLIIVVVFIVDVRATQTPSNGVHGVCHGTIAGHGTSDDANFGRSGSLRMLPHSLCLPFCRPAKAAIPGEEEDNTQLVAGCVHHRGGVVPTNQC